MPLKKVLDEAEGASAKAKAHLPTHPSRAASEMPDNSELKKYYNRPNDEGQKELHKKHLPTHKSSAEDQTPEKFHEEQDVQSEALEKDAEDSHAKKPAVDPAYDGHDVANRMKDGVYEEKELATHKKDGEEELKTKKVDGEEELAVEDAHLDAYNSVVQGKDNKEANKKIHEHVATILDGNENLSEGFRKKTATIFEAAVKEQVEVNSKRIYEHYQSKLEEVKQQNLKELSQNLDSFLNVVVEEWLKENEESIEQSIEVQLAESFFDGLKELFENHNIVVPQEKVNLLNDLSEENEKLQKELNETLSQVVELRKQEEERRKKDIISENSKGLADTEKEKLHALAENLSYLSDDDFSEKVQTIRESYFSKSSHKLQDLAETQIENPVAEEKQEVRKDPKMEGYLSALNRMDKYRK
jgi:hypothetical protein